MAVDYIRPRTTQELEAILNLLQRDTQYWAYFSGFIGALDETHIHVMITRGKETICFLNRKRNLSLNDLAMCDCYMLFTYLIVGMAGSTHDAHVLSIVIRDALLFSVRPKGKYYLVDYGYANIRGYLAPYTNIGAAAEDIIYKMFNRWHASLRSVMERTFGVEKKKWRVLNEFRRYNITVQRRVIFATMELHTFIRQKNIEDFDSEKAYGESDVSHGQQNVSDDANDDQGIGVEEEIKAGNYMKIVCDQIA